MLEDSTVQTYNIVSQLGHVVPPGILNIALKIYAKGTVIPCAGLTAVNLTRLIHKTTSLAETDDFVQRTFVFVVCHFYKTPFPYRIARDIK